MKTTLWMLVAALGTTGCDSSMMSDPDRMRSMLEDVRYENDQHVRTANGAASTVVLRDEMVRHGSTMDAMMGDMGDAMDGMSHCTGAGMGAMRSMRDDMMDEMDVHRSTMDQAAGLGDARDEVSRHDGAMRDLLDGMDEATSRMGCRM